MREPATICLRPLQVELTFDLMTLKVVSESRMTLVFLSLSVLDLGPTYATDRQTDVR